MQDTDFMEENTQKSHRNPNKVSIFLLKTRKGTNAMIIGTATDLPMLLMSVMSGSSSALKMLRGRAESTIRALNVTLEDISAAGCLKGGVDYFF